MKTLVHGDLWHNNIYFSNHKVLFTEWQMCHTGTPANDLCFFLFSR
jgi:fructosamine-3-kinase